MKNLLVFGLLVVLSCRSIPLPTVYTLPNGWSLSPVGTSFTLGDLPLNMVVSPSGRYALVSNNGQSTHSLQWIDLREEKVLHTLEVPKLWFGLAIAGNERTVYAAAGNDHCIRRYDISNNQLAYRDSFPLQADGEMNIWPSGICLDEHRGRLHVVSKESNKFYTFDLNSKILLNNDKLPSEAYSILLSPDKSDLLITLWGGNALAVYNASTLAFKHSIPVGSHPNDICFNRDGLIAYVANANDNTVSVVDLIAKKVVETLNASLYPGAPAGSTTNSVALSSDGRSLYVANADNNCLAVFDVSTYKQSRSKGFIPVGWYPTVVRFAQNKIWVANGKGFTSKPNAYGPSPIRSRNSSIRHQGDSTKPKKVEYIGGLFIGEMSVLSVPDEKTLKAYTKRVYANTPFRQDQMTEAEGKEGNPIPRKVGDPSPIKYVFYVIKENRTYDQVLGDMPEGNGDSSLCLFPEFYTPNQHALARQFVLLDNFYVDAEVSADGHNWSTAAYATDYTEKTWQTSYGSRGGTYDYEGTRKLAHPDKGYIWDHLKRAGISYRTYGEFADDGKANIPALEGHFCPEFTSWDESVRDTTRFRQWRVDFERLLAAGKVPRFNSMRFINDHTQGLAKGKPTPYAHIADNDWATGMLVDYLSKSPIWNECAVFFIEDDAQNGADHVDAHRSIAFVAGGLVKRNYVDHTMYSTSSMLRTIELILGIPPMSQYDAAATPMYRCFTSKVDKTPFHAIPANIPLDGVNTVTNIWQQKSETFDFSKEDAAPDLLFNEVLWHAIKGDKIPWPGPTRAAFLRVTEADED